MSTRQPLLTVAMLLAAGLLVVTAGARRTPPQPCAPGTFALAAGDAAGLASLVGADVGRFTLGPGSLVALGSCVANGSVTAKRRATLVNARFPLCGSAVNAKLAVIIQAPTCGGANGTLKVRRHKPAHFAATRGTNESTTTLPSTTTTLPSLPPLCGNGIVDPGEECEGLVGCGARKRCTSSCTCEPEPAPAPTSQGLIAEALATGTIDYSTSLIYRAYALFGDSRLPPQYDGQSWRFEDQGLFHEASGAWGSLTPAAQTALQPFLVRPTDPKSIYAPPSANNALGRARDAGTSLSDIACPYAPGAAFPDWRPTESSHFVVWSCGGGDPAQDPDASLRSIVGDVAEQAWSAITPEAATPRPDDFLSGPAPQTRIDVYVVHGADCKVRQGVCVPLETDTDGRRPLAAVIPTSPCDRGANGALTSSGFMLVDAGSVQPAPSSGPWKFRYVFAHEFFHLVADAMNLEAQGAGCFDPSNAATVATSWLSEASAEWAAWAFFKDDGPDERRNLFLAFQEFRPASTVSLLSVDDQRPYEAFLYPFFLQQESGGARAPFLGMWRGSTAARTPADLDSQLDQALPFESHFRDFAIRNFDDAVRLPPSEPRYQSQDAAIPVNELPILQEPGLELMQPGPRIMRPAALQPLTAQYEHYTVADAVRYLRIDVDAVVNSSFVDLDALMNVHGTWTRRKGNGGVLEFCRDDSADDLQELYLIVTNHDRRRGQAVSGDYTVETRAICPSGWFGSLHYVYTDDEVGTFTDATGYYAKDHHFRTEDRWTFQSTTPGMPPDTLDTIDAVWAGSIDVTQIDVTEHGFCVGYEDRYVNSEYSGSGSGPQQFRVNPTDADPNQITLVPAYGSALNHIPAIGTTHRVQCNLPPSDQPISSTWDDGVSEATVGLPILVPDMNDPTHYAGTATVSHYEQPGIGGAPHVIDAKVIWDIRRVRQGK